MTVSTGGTVEELEAQITALRYEQQGWEAAVQDAEQLRVAADDAEVAAIKAQQRADVLLAEACSGYADCSDELNQQLTAWRALVPQQRGPVD